MNRNNAILVILILVIIAGSIYYFSEPAMQTVEAPGPVAPTSTQSVTSAPEPAEATDEEQDAAEAYVRENIVTLSTEPAVLGGTFYVTDIEADSDWTGTVEYEDGHVAFVADFTYAVNASGTPRITSFTVRP